MAICSLRAILFCQITSFIVHAQHDAITGYTPGSDVVQHSRIDLDQNVFEDYLKNGDFVSAKNVYEKGGHSGAHEVLTLKSPLVKDVAKKTSVTQGETKKGHVKKDAAQGATTIEINYDSVCYTGGLKTENQSTDGCFDLSQTITIGDLSLEVTGGQRKYRTLKGFSYANNKPPDGSDKMKGQEMYEIYRAYFKDPAYGHAQVMAALDNNGKCTDANSADGCKEDARKQIAKKGSLFLNVWMYILREAEDAIQDCESGCGNSCNDDPSVHAWDEAVAFYSGSMAGKDMNGAKGKLMWMLTGVLCSKFGNREGKKNLCEENKLNNEIMGEFKKGKDFLADGNCVETIRIKKRLFQLMTIPLVQGFYRYAWRLLNDPQAVAKRTNLLGEADSFASAILPQVAMCNKSVADKIAKNTLYTTANLASPMADGYKDVKMALESVYPCLGITCKDIGSYLKIEDNQITGVAQDGEACVDQEEMPESSGSGVEMWVVILVVVLVGLAGGGIGYCVAQSKQQTGLLDRGNEMTTATA